MLWIFLCITFWFSMEVFTVAENNTMTSITGITGEVTTRKPVNFVHTSNTEIRPYRHNIVLVNPPQTSSKPFFEEGDGPTNITAKLGTTVLIDCKIGLLFDKTVSWLRRKGDSLHLLTVGRHTYSVDQRIALSFRYPNNWRLEISSVTRRDDGRYECQVATHPPIAKVIYLKVQAPEVEILDEKGRLVMERYYKAGSTIHLYCVVKQAEGNPSENIEWSKGNVILHKGISTNSTPGVNISSLKISKVKKHHSGKYVCTADQLATASVTLHILNGELPAAIHGGCRVNAVSQLIIIFVSLLFSLFLHHYSFSNR